MRKFVIEYSTGEYDSYVNHTFTVGADSKEEVLEQMKSASEKLIAHNKILDDFASTKPRISINSSESEKTKAAQWSRDWLKLNNDHGHKKYSIEIFGGEIPADYMTNSEFENLFCDLQIYDLDEWFEMMNIKNNK